MLLNTLLEGTTDPMDSLYRLAYARGFLVEQQGNDIVISDNASDCSRAKDLPTDRSDWDDLLCQIKGMVEVRGNRIVSYTDKFSANKTYERFFVQNDHISYETVNMNYRATYEFFKKSESPAKVLTLELEPFVAMYVKALSSIKIHTFESCQGHDERPSVKIRLAGKCHAAFHEALWAVDDGLKRFELSWNPSQMETDMAIHYNTKIRQSIFAKVIRAGQYIYEHRFDFRSLRERVGHAITKDDAEMSLDKLTQKMSDIIKSCELINSPKHQ